MRSDVPRFPFLEGRVLAIFVRSLEIKLQNCIQQHRHPPPKHLVFTSQAKAVSPPHPSKVISSLSLASARNSWVKVGVSWSEDRKAKESMPLIQILFVLIVVGVLLWLVNQFIPMAGSIKSILNAVVVIGVVLWLLNVFGLFHSLSRIRVG